MSKHPDIGNGYPIREIALDSINLSLHPNPCTSSGGRKSTSLPLQ